MISTIDKKHGEKKTIHVIANGYHENYYDAALWENSLGNDKRFKFVKSYKEADVILLLGCANTFIRQRNGGRPLGSDPMGADHREGN